MESEVSWTGQKLADKKEIAPPIDFSEDSDIFSARELLKGIKMLLKFWKISLELSVNSHPIIITLWSNFQV